MDRVIDDHARTATDAWAALLGPAPRLRALPRVTNPVWRVDGDDLPPLVLKQLPEHPAGVTPVVEFRVLTHLHRAGVTVALPIVTDAGAVVATVDRRSWTLAPELAGSPAGPDDDARTAHRVGAAIGRLDRALAECPWPAPSYADDPLAVLDEVTPQLPADAVDRLTPLLPRLREACTDLPMQLTHGDCNAGNVLVGPTGEVGFLDLDHLPRGPRIRDLAYFLVSRLGRRLSGSHPDRVLDGWATGLAPALAGFHRAHPITAGERAALVPLMLVTEVAGAHWSLHGWTPDPAAHRRSLTTLLHLVRRFDALQASATAG